LHRVDVVDKALLLYYIEHIEVIIEGRPRCKRHQRRAQHDTGLARDRQGLEDVGSAMPLLQIGEDGVAQRLDG
jgi:hypothetical protein